MFTKIQAAQGPGVSLETLGPPLRDQCWAGTRSLHYRAAAVWKGAWGNEGLVRKTRVSPPPCQDPILPWMPLRASLAPTALETQLQVASPGAFLPPRELAGHGEQASPCSFSSS